MKKFLILALFVALVSGTSLWASGASEKSDKMDKSNSTMMDKSDKMGSDKSDGMMMDKSGNMGSGKSDGMMDSSGTMSSDKSAGMMDTSDKMMKGMTYMGYLSDVDCGTSGKGGDGADMVNSPQDHTKACLIECKDSGFGISMKKGSAYTFVAFDKAGSDMALKLLAKIKKDKGISIKVVGDMVDGKIKVTSIEESKMM